MTQDPPSITISPRPPTQGAEASVTYVGTLPAAVTISFKPDTIAKIRLTIDASGVATFIVPATAETYKIIDDAGQADAETGHTQEA